MPQRGHVRGESFKVGPRWKRRDANLSGGERLFGIHESHQALLPARLEAARHQAVLGLAGMEGPLGSFGFVAGALDGQLGRPGPP